MNSPILKCLALLMVVGCGDDSGGGAQGSGAQGSGSDTSPVTGQASSSSGQTSGGSVTTATSATSANSSQSSGGETEGALGCGASPEALSDCVDPAAYQADLEFIAELREPGSLHWQAVQDLCADRLTELGFDVELFEYDTGVNVLGTKAGATPDAPRVLIGAHYDHIGGCLGADDNATGVAASLEAARVLSEGAFDRGLTIACWDEEERGLVGSEAFAQSARSQGIEVAVYYNFEMIGFATDEPETQRIPTGFDLVFPSQVSAIEDNDNRGDFIFLTGDDLAVKSLASFEEHASRLGLPAIVVTLTAAQKTNALFGDLRRSDHASFWDVDYPAIFISDTGEFRNDRYHCLQGEDTVDSLTSSFTEGVIRATVASAADSLGLLP